MGGRGQNCRFAWDFFAGMRPWDDLRDVRDDNRTAFHAILQSRKLIRAEGNRSFHGTFLGAYRLSRTRTSTRSITRIESPRRFWSGIERARPRLRPFGE